MALKSTEVVRSAADIDNMSEVENGSVVEVETDTESEAEMDEKSEDGTERRPDVERGRESKAEIREECGAETQRQSAAEANEKSNVESETKGPVRFQLQARKRDLIQGTFEELTGDLDDGPPKLKKPRCVEFPKISENEFLEVVNSIENACQEKKWKDAFEMVDFLCARRCDERVMEMKAQLQMEVGENFEAVKNCERAIKLNPRWWEGHRTHGRCLLSLGESALAVKAFERAIYINPADEDLRSELRSALGSERVH